MIRATQTRLQAEAATRFGLNAVNPETSAPRDVIWCPSRIALRKRQEQSAALGRPPEQNFPFISFFRTGYRGEMERLNTPLAQKGAATDDSNSVYYKMKPLNLAFQLEFWTNDEEQYEAAIKAWYDWKLPGDILTLTDLEGVTFDLGLKFLDAQDNSQIPEIFDIGEIHRATFPIAISSYIITRDPESPEVFQTIETIQWSYRDNSFVLDKADAPIIKTVVVSEAIYYDDDAYYDAGHHYNP